VLKKQTKLFERDDHFDCYKKPEKSMDSYGKLYRPYEHRSQKQDDVVEYFKYEEKKRRGFSSPYLKINPFEVCFEDYVETLKEKFKHFGETEAHIRVMTLLEAKYNAAKATFV